MITENVIDFHSIKVGLNFQKKQTHKTKWGIFVTLCSIGFFLYVCYYQGKQLLDKKKPFVVTNEIFVRNPQRMEFDGIQQTLMLALRTISGIPISNPSLYYFTARSLTMKSRFNQTSNYNQTYLEEKQLKMRPCNINDIKVEKLKSFFSKIDLNKYSCFDEKENIYIEGDISGDYYTKVEIFIKQCRNSSIANSVVCQPQSKIDEALGYNNLMIYTIDKLVDPTNLKDPFSYEGMNLFTPCSNKMSKEITFSYQNYYIQTDTGIINEDIQIMRDFIFGSQQETISFEDPNDIAKLVLKPSKNRQVLLQRRYMKISDLVAQVGGIFNVISIIGAIIAIPFAKFHMNTEIVKKLFDFNFEENEHINNKEIKQELPQRDSIQNKQLDGQPERADINNKKDYLDHSQKQSELIFQINKSKQSFNSGNDSKLKLLSQKPQRQQQKDDSNIQSQQASSQWQQNNATQQTNTSQTPLQYNVLQKQSSNFDDLAVYSRSLSQTKQVLSYKNETKQQIKHLKSDTDINNIKSSILQWISKKMKPIKELNFYSAFDYFQHLVYPFTEKVKRMKPLIDTSIKKVQSHLDLEFILNKLQEVDKLKQIILTDDQIKLFELIPRPVIQKDHKTNKIIIISKYYNDEKSQQEKQEAAYQSLLKILNKEKRSQRDLKLIELLDESLLKIVQDEQDERTCLGQNNKLIQKMQSSYQDDEIKEIADMFKDQSQQKNNQTQNDSQFNSQEKMSPEHQSNQQTFHTQENCMKLNEEEDLISEKKFKYQLKIHRNSLNVN